MGGEDVPILAFLIVVMVTMMVALFVMSPITGIIVLLSIVISLLFLE